MNCRDVLERDLIERFAAGSLPSDERSAFELHLLGCDRCFEDARTAMAIRDELVRGRAAPPFVTAERTRVPVWTISAAAAVVLAAVVWLVLQRPGLPDSTGEDTAPPIAAPTAPTGPAAPAIPGDVILELARVEPPEYEEPALRGGEAGSAIDFRDAMRAYRRADYAAAIRGLEVAAAGDPRPPQARFFLGASYLLANRVEEAIECLRQVALDPSSPFADEARFYLAKALLRAGRLEEARAELERLLVAPNDWGAEARSLLARLDDRVPAQTKPVGEGLDGR